MLSERIAEKISQGLAIAKTLHGAGRLDDARHACRLILKIDPENAGARVRLGLIARSEGRHAEATEEFAAARRKQPSDPYIVGLLAASYREAGQLDAAEQVLSEVLPMVADHAGLLAEKGRCELDRGRPAEAIRYLEGSKALKPDDASINSLLGVAYRRIGNRADARRAFEAALAFDPRDPSALLGLGNELLDDENLPEAIEYFRQALSVRPNFVKAQKNLAYTLSLANEIEPARAAFERLLQIHPDYPEGHMDYGLFLLSIGEFRKGWLEYEQRWRFDRFEERDWGQGLPRWDGSPLNGRRLLLWGEQGIGDHILYGTMLPDIARRAGGRIAVAVEARLVPLFARSLADAQIMVVERGQPIEADVQAPFGSMGLWSRFRPQDCGSGIYLKAEAARSSALRARYAALGQPGDKLVGLSWRSTNWHIGSYKSLDLETLLPVLRRPGLLWVSLQYGDVSAEIAAFGRRHGVAIHQDPDIDAIRDLDGLAAQIAALDGVVSTSNSTVHFAGALGKPCWVLLPFGRGRMWYWPREGERTPWYDSLHLIRQPRRGDWSAAMLRLNEVLFNHG